jgi:hypothetical protein
VGLVRRTACVLALAVATVAGCGARPQPFPGSAAPLTGTGTPAASTSPTSSATPGPSGSPLPAVPTVFRPLTASGFGVSVSLPVPDGWVREPSASAGLIRTDVDLRTPEVLLRIDLSARGSGSARDAATRNEAATRLTGYQRIAITPVTGVGDDAADWAFTFERDGTRRVVDRQIVAGTAGIAVYYSAPTALYERYLPVWQRAVRGLSITTS